MEVTVELETAISPSYDNPDQIDDNITEDNTNSSSISFNDAGNWLSANLPTSALFLPPSGGSSSAAASGGFRKPNFARRLSSTVTLASFEDVFPIADVNQLAKFDQLLLLFPSPSTPDPLVNNVSLSSTNSTSVIGTVSQMSSSPGNSGGNWSIKNFASSFFSSR
jgi:hypothetical protein